MKKRVLLIASTTGYQTHVFAEAAERMGLELVMATDRCHVLEDPWGDHAVPVRFEDPSPGIESLGEYGPFAGIVAVGDRPALMAAQAAERLGLRFSPPDAVLASQNKFLARERFREAGLATPSYKLVPLNADPHAAARATPYPCVLKPLSLSASRGVIRADNVQEFVTALARIRKMIEGEACLLVENFIPGREFALEGLVTDGRLQMLALFDKPDPLDGPFFEETIYVTPSRESERVQEAIRDTVQRAVSALGLTRGPAHAEMRINGAGVWILEVAARPIGGLCARVLRFGDRTLEEVILLHALGEDVRHVELSPGAHGVMMIPIPCAGVYSGVEGLENARRVPGIEDVVITAKEGQTLLPLPEGASYLGFIFARGGTAGAVEEALRESHACLKFHLPAALPVVR